MNFSFYTLGCKVNQCESQALEQLARQRGHTIVPDHADVCIINTCSVTSASERKNLRAIHRCRAANPQAILAVCGCYSQLNADKLRAMPQIDLVGGTAQRAQLLLQCEAMAQTGRLASPSLTAVDELFERLPGGAPSRRTRAYLKIQDGCNRFCAYCIIPYARGRSRSLAPQAVLQDMAAIGQFGAKECVLTGIEISSYGADLTPPCSLAQLLEQLPETMGDMRLRLGSLEPRSVDERLCQALLRYPRLAQHFHLSLQSGCDQTLKRMGRQYTAEAFLGKIQLLRRYFPQCAITTDLIVGFPGESDAEFSQTLDFLQRCQLADIHVFSFSPRAGTRAASLPDPVAEPCKKWRRQQVLRQLTLDQRRYRRQFVGQSLSILTERARHGVVHGHSDYDFTIALIGARPCPNQWKRVIVTDLDENNQLWGQEVSQ